MARLLTDTEIAAQLSDLAGWHRTDDGSGITATFELADFAAALGFVNRVGDEAEQMNHHPDVDIRWATVTLTLATHSAGGLTQLDIELAHRISALPRSPSA